MEQFERLRKLYRPIQPSIFGGASDVQYIEASPASSLKDFIYCYWQLKVDFPLSEEFVYRVVSDGCVDLFFNNKNISDSLIMGFCKNYTEFALEPSFNYIGIRFFPSVFPHLFQIAASELANKTTRVVDVLPDLVQVMNREMPNHNSFISVQEKLNLIFENYIKDVSINVDHRFYDALCLIMEHSGMVEVECELKTGLSSRQLRRVFNYFIGATPKTFSRVVRFQKVLRSWSSIQSAKDNKLFYDAGFYDQAHFIKEFKKFYGVTPSQALR